jgi:hypothetical protein
LVVALFPYNVHYMCKSVVSSVVVPWARSVLESEIDLCWGEWDSVAARGMCWGRIMSGGVSKTCQRSCWGDSRVIV